MVFLISKSCVVAPHLGRLIGTVWVRGHNICFHAELIKIIPFITRYSLLSGVLIWHTGAFRFWRIMIYKGSKWRGKFDVNL